MPLLQMIQANPFATIAIVAFVGWLVMSRKNGDEVAAATKQLPTITPALKSRNNVEVFESLDVVVAALRDKGWPETDIKALVDSIASKLFSSPPPGV